MNILQKVTWKALMKNKTRTWVTIIGIMLSAAMFTAVTTCASSLQNYLLRTTIAVGGSWHGRQLDVSSGHANRLEQQEGLKSFLVLDKVGYASIGSKNEYKPYLMVEGYRGTLDGMLPFTLTAGRLPENCNELLIPNHLYTNGGVELALGDSLTLALGDRKLDGYNLKQNNPYQQEEVLLERETREYTVVGFYDRFPYSIENYEAPGYTALTLSDGSGAYHADVYLEMKNPWKIDEVLGYTEYHEDLLRFAGASMDVSFNRVLYGLSAILMGIILFGSVSLIYNAFSISVSERIKQFGILKTVGATKSQIRGSVYFEALVLSAVGIPLGVLSGIAGIAVTLHFTRQMFDAILGGNGVQLTLHVSVWSVVIAAAVAMITVLISARIPAQRAIKQNAIDAVRQTAEIRIRPKKVRTPRWVYKLFGFPGMLADKNFKRNRRKYRTTVMSLFMSVMLFVSASSFCSYLTRSVDQVTTIRGYDLSYHYNHQDQLSQEEFHAHLDDLSAIDEYFYCDMKYFNFHVPTSFLNPKQMKKWGVEATDDWEIIGYLIFINDERFDQWAEENGLDPKLYYDPEKLNAIGVDDTTYWNGEKYDHAQIFLDQETPFTYRYFPDQIGEYFNTEETRLTEEGERMQIYRNEAGEQMEYAQSDPRFAHHGTIAHFVKSTPLKVNYSAVQLVYPMSMRQVLFPGDTKESVDYYFNAEDHRTAEQQLQNLLLNLRIDQNGVYNSHTDVDSDRALVTVVNVFSYGFIILISLIALANVFNTVSTNVALRRREFAMLRSVGMGERALNRMMNYECILYGVKGLSSGLIAAVGVTFLIYLVVNQGILTNFYIPWYSITLAVVSVFLVVFASMLYAMKKIKGEDPISALKNENL